MVKQCPTTTHLWGKEKEPKKRTTVGNADISCGSDGSREGRQFCFRKVWESVPRKAETLRPRTIHVAWTLRPRTIEGKECRCVCVCVGWGVAWYVCVRGGGYMCKFETITLVEPGVVHTFKAERC